MEKLDTMKRASVILNQIRQEAQAKDGWVKIKPDSREWDAIFFAEDILSSFSEKISVLSAIVRRI